MMEVQRVFNPKITITKEKKNEQKKGLKVVDMILPQTKNKENENAKEEKGDLGSGGGRLDWVR